MVDKWFMDCSPCGVSEAHDSEDDAIGAALEHINAKHPDVPPHVRGVEKIGHVQQRTMLTAHDDVSQAPAQLPSGTGEAGSVVASTSPVAPAQSDPETSTKPQGDNTAAQE